jgi:uncharacterized protein YuzE
MRITYDSQADAAYIYLTEIEPGGVTSGSTLNRHMEMASSVNCDFNAADQLVGIEVLGASRVLPSEVLARAERLGQ